MNKRRLPTPTLLEVPRWTPDILREVEGRTYGTPGGHLQHTIARTRTQIITTLVPRGGLLAAALVIGAVGIREIYLSDLPEGTARVLQALIIAAYAGLFIWLNPIKRVLALRAERGRNLAGLEGERRVAALLEDLPPEYRIIHGVDITWPEQYSEDIDHVIIGPTGLILVDAKNYSGDLVLATNAIVQNNRNITRQLVDATERRATHLGTFLGWTAPMRKIVCFTGSACVNGRLGNVQFTDRNGLKYAITSGDKAVHPDLVKEVAEDVALLSPTATTEQPWRTIFKYLPPSKKRAHKYRAFYWPATILQAPAGLASAATGFVTAFNLFHLLMSTGRVPLTPHHMLEGGALSSEGVVSS